MYTSYVPLQGKLLQRWVLVQAVEHVRLLIVVRRENNVVDDVLKCLGKWSVSIYTRGDV